MFRDTTVTIPNRTRTLATMRLRLLFALAAWPASLQAQSASLLLTGARIWTGDSARPWAQAVAVSGDRILAVGTAAELARYRGPGTRVVRLDGRFIAPGFIDNHTHFAQAGALLLGVNLLDSSDMYG